MVAKLRRRPAAAKAAPASLPKRARRRTAQDLPGRRCLRLRHVRIRCESGDMLVKVGGSSAPAVEAPQVKRELGAGAPLDTWALARSTFHREGIVVLRGLLPTSLVREARRRILRELAEAGALDPKAPRDEARVAAACTAGERPLPSLLRRLDVQQLPSVLRVLEHPALARAAAALLGVEEAETTFYKWLRAVPPGTFTGPHMDRAYVGASSARLTIWVPLGSVPARTRGPGALCWIPRSHVDPAVVNRFRHYQRVGADGERSGWLAPDPGALELPVGCNAGWQSVDFAAGDVAVFGMDLLHTTVPNQTHSFRLSCDTRWQPLGAPPGDVPVGPWRRAAGSHSPSREETSGTAAVDGSP
mmetsp:Transcript_28845/g.52705  ORF Transcript_28845/g.52705 Transcript_28845/m.52705 type:complete len:359 (+) Transcript_28845:56-1132(+)